LSSDGGVILGEPMQGKVFRRFSNTGAEATAFRGCGVTPADDGAGGFWAISVEANQNRFCHTNIAGQIAYGDYIPRWIAEFGRSTVLPDGDILWQTSIGDLTRVRRTKSGRITIATVLLGVRSPTAVVSDAASNTEYAYTTRTIDYVERNNTTRETVNLKTVKLPEPANN
jgi:hypothetical protein